MGDFLLDEWVACHREKSGERVDYDIDWCVVVAGVESYLLRAVRLRLSKLEDESTHG